MSDGCDNPGTTTVDVGFGPRMVSSQPFRESHVWNRALAVAPPG